MHKHQMKAVPAKHTKKTLYFECFICCEDFVIRRSNYRKLFTKLRNPRHQRSFSSRYKQGGSLKMIGVRSSR